MEQNNGNNTIGGSMEKYDIDELYHLLRDASNDESDLPKFIYGLSRHLLAGGDYLGLIQYSAFYGENFLLEPTHKAIVERGWTPGRVVEFGAGLGWLGRGLAAKLNFIPAMFVDKRQWSMIDVVADLETDTGIDKVLSVMKEGDLIVMADFLHCVVNPTQILEAFSSYNMAILEYMAVDPRLADSYEKQIKRYGANPIGVTEYLPLFKQLNRPTDIKDIDPYVLILIDRT